MFYLINSSKVSVREYLYGGPLLLKPLVLLIACVSKGFKIRIPGSIDIPPVDAISPFQVAADDIEPEMKSELIAAADNLKSLGFVEVSWYRINDTRHNTRYASLLMMSADGATLAWIRIRRWPQLSKSGKRLRVAMYSRREPDKFMMTTSANRDLLDPPTWQVEYLTGKSAGEIWQRHREQLVSFFGAQRADSVTNASEAVLWLDELQKQCVDFQSSRGVLEPISSSEQTAVTATSNSASIALDASSEVINPVSGSATATMATSQFATTQVSNDGLQPVIDAVRAMESKQSQWFSKLLILVVSVALFVGIGAARWNWELVLLLVPILFVHELGHFIAMRIFGYRNVQMFFIPLLGAAVTGRHYSVAGWKKAMVSLAGPAPSIVIGLILGVIAVFTGSQLLFMAAGMTLVINAMNLLPFLPLDGGWLAHITLFSRSSKLDLVFRVLTVLCLFGISVLLDDRILMYVGIAMIVGLPFVWKTMRVTDELRHHPLPPPVDDVIPEQAIRMIAEAVQRGNIPINGVKQLATTTVNVYQSLASRPPSWPATIGILTLHIGSFMLAIIGGFLLMGMQAWKSYNVFDVPDTIKRHIAMPLVKGQLQQGTSSLPRGQLMLWEFANDDQATAAFEELNDEPEPSLARLGNVVFASHPTASEKDAEQLKPLGTNGDAMFNMRERMKGIERDARSNSALLLQTATPLAKRWFSGRRAMYPILVFCFSSGDAAESTAAQLQSLPRLQSECLPIPPWMPGRPLTDQELRLRGLLAILRGSSQETPWDPDANLQRDEKALEGSDTWDKTRWEQYQHDVRAKSETLKVKKNEWIEAQKLSASDVEKRMLEAFQAFEMAQVEFLKKREQQRTQRATGGAVVENSADDVYPDLNNYLRPLENDLGYLAKDSIDNRFAGMFSARKASSNELQEDLEVEAEHVVVVEGPLGPDPTLMIAAMAAWMKRAGAEKAYWQYDEWILPEDEAKPDQTPHPPAIQ